MKENIIENNFKYNKKYKLPNVTLKIKNIENVPLTDEEEERNNKSMDNTNNNSPQIMKIAKKKIKDDLMPFKINNKNSHDESNQLMNSTSIKSNSKIERNKSLPFYENI